MSTSPTGPTIACEKCKQGTMVPASVARMGEGLRIIGYLLWIPALLLLVGSTACGALMGGSGTSVASKQMRDARVRASEQLLDIAALPRSEAEAFATTGILARSTLDALPSAAKARAEAIISTHSAATAGSAIGAGAVAGIAGVGVIASWVFGLPFLIVGLLLTRKKNVWKCPVCQSVFDRA